MFGVCLLTMLLLLLLLFFSRRGSCQNPELLRCYLLEDLQNDAKSTSTLERKRAREAIGACVVGVVWGLGQALEAARKLALGWITWFCFG